MSVLNGYCKYKRYVKKDTGYQLCSHWTSSNTVHFDDGKTAQEKLGAIDGITDSLTSTSSNVALSAKSGKNLQDQVTQLNTHIGIIGEYFYGKTDGATAGAGHTNIISMLLDVGTYVVSFVFDGYTTSSSNYKAIRIIDYNGVTFYIAMELQGASMSGCAVVKMDKKMSIYLQLISPGGLGYSSARMRAVRIG